MKKLVPKRKMRIKLVPMELQARIPHLYAQEKLSDPVAVLRLFDPCSRFSFYVFEGCRKPDGDLKLFGYIRSHVGPDCDGFGETSLRELESIPGLGLGLARDPLFRSARLSEIRGWS